MNYERSSLIEEAIAIHSGKKEVYQMISELSNSGAFEEFKWKQPPGTHIWYSNIIGYPHFRIEIASGSGKVYWINDKEPRVNPFPPLEYILDNVDSDTQALLLFHLDILITDTYMVTDKETGRYVSVNRRN